MNHSKRKQTGGCGANTAEIYLVLVADVQLRVRLQNKSVELSIRFLNPPHLKITP